MSQSNNKKEQETPDKPTSQLTEKQKKWIKSGIFFAIIIGLFIVNNLDGEPENGPYPPNYMSYSNKTLQLSDYTGKIVIIDFWATWCAPCRKGIPDFVELKNEFPDTELEIIGISVDDVRSKKNVEDFLKEFNVNYPVVWGNQTVKYKYGGVNEIPTSFLVDKQGNVVSQHVGYVSKETYVKEINKLLSSTGGKNDISEKVKAPDFRLPLINDIEA